MLHGQYGKLNRMALKYRQKSGKKAWLLIHQTKRKEFPTNTPSKTAFSLGESIADVNMVIDADEDTTPSCLELQRNAVAITD